MNDVLTCRSTFFSTSLLLCCCTTCIAIPCLLLQCLPAAVSPCRLQSDPCRLQCSVELCPYKA